MTTTQSTAHDAHDVWPLISKPGTSWCRTCQVHFTPAPTPTASVKPGCEACSTGYHERCRDRRFARVLASTTMLGCQPTASYCCCQDVLPS
jgi:hypothetical protein